MYVFIRSGHGLQLSENGLRIWIDWHKILVSDVYVQASLLSNQPPSIHRTAEQPVNIGSGIDLFSRTISSLSISSVPA